MNYSGYQLDELKQMLKDKHQAINHNRKNISHLIYQIEELQRALEACNRDKKLIKREMKARLNNGTSIKKDREKEK